MKPQTNVRLDEDLKKAATEQAEREGRSLSNLIALAVRKYIEEHAPKPKPPGKSKPR